MSKIMYIILILLWLPTNAQRWDGCGLFSPYQINIHDYSRYIDSSKSKPNIQLSTGNDDAYNQFYIQLNINSGVEEYKRRPLNVSLVLDKSSSMYEFNRMDKLKIAVKEFIQLLEPGDYFSIITYDDEAQIIIPSTKFECPIDAMSKVDSIQIGRMTNIIAGLNYGYAEINKELDPKRINRLVLFSDGMSTIGCTNTESMIKVAQKAKNRGIETSTFGLGEDINFHFLSNLAKVGKGISHFIGDCDSVSGDIKTHLVSEMKSMLSITKDIAIKLTYPNYVDPILVYGMDMRQNKRGELLIEIPSFPIMHSQKMLIHFKINKRSKQIPIKAEMFIEEHGKQSETSLAINICKDPMCNNLSNQEVGATYACAYAIEELRTSLKYFSNSKYMQAYSTLEKCIGLLTKSEYIEHMAVDRISDLLKIQKEFTRLHLSEVRQ